ncbi:MAG TPA: AbrB/MazE/SpoVT family DNA-binding domain-containing protein [Reyranella sp.]|nr:AbrB/MazE/SpoVT family DNA-binding domain-containing protein [Reyranella sp.]
MRITSKGQVTIPQDIRERAGLLPHTEVEFIYDGKVVKIVRADRRTKKKTSRGARLVEHMRGRGTVKLTTDQITAMTRG